MKKNLLILMLTLGTITSYSQGVIAHWDMNGGTNDVSGNGHNGHMHNVTPAAGETGVANTAYSFDGATSYITVPADPAFNLTKFSICAKVKVAGFYNGLCQDNMIFERGQAAAHTAGSYCLSFDDNQADSNCSAIDSNLDVFWGGARLVPYSYYASYYTPTIVKDQWYNVVVTLNDTVWKTYVNGVLKITAPVTVVGGAIGVSSDSVSIGCNIYGVVAGSYQSYFKGVIDDVILYNRALTDSEALQYTDTTSCGTITLQPTDTTVNFGSNTKLYVTTTIASPTYQWQEYEAGTFVNLINVPPYSGVTTDTLSFTSAPMSLDSTLYRCIISGGSCHDTTTIVVLTVHNTHVGVKDIISCDMISVFPIPANNNISVKLPVNAGDANIQLINNVGQVLSEQNVIGSTCTVDLSTQAVGIYILRVQIDGQVFYKKILKN